MKILFISDFDNTLADTYGPYGEGNIFRTKTLPDIDEATKIYEEHRRGPDDIVMYQKLLELYGIDDPYSFFEKVGMGKQLFPDSKDFLASLRDLEYVTSVVLTTGDEDLQQVKVDLTGVGEYVDEVVVTRNRNKIQHIRDLHEKYQPEHTIFLDDRIHMTYEDFAFPITIIEMNRKKSIEGNTVVHSLEEVLSFL